MLQAVIMRERKVLLSYIGDIKYETIEVLLNKANIEMEKVHIDSRIKKKIYRVMVECLENVLKHSDLLDFISENPNYKYSRFLFEFENNEFYLSTGNIINNDSIDELLQKINLVNGLDFSGLRKLHDHVITNGKISIKGGAGLGIIDIALRSNNQLNYKIDPIDSNYSYFNLTIKISKDN